MIRAIVSLLCISHAIAAFQHFLRHTRFFLEGFSIAECTPYAFRMPHRGILHKPAVFCRRVLAQDRPHKDPDVGPAPRTSFFPNPALARRVSRAYIPAHGDNQFEFPETEGGLSFP
jgi:hypothetical protein